MQFSAITTLFALAAVATAAPTEVQARTDGGNSCNNNQQFVCCNGVLNLSCLVQILGLPSTCNGQSYCCTTTQGNGALIDIDALNCVQL
ncbi:hypothetical protein F4677DRAFT_445702 [Hypoxylon crocopeplum]|nr:hypothetical protein F4677DRAFT_445702 [Hypoxylon crocopeplum]